MKGILVVLSTLLLPLSLQAEFKAGSAKTDITPKTLPVIVNGGMISRTRDQVKTPLSARSLAFTDGKETIVIVVADSCMMPRDLLDKAKQMASEKSGIPVNRILISATHTHSAPSCMGALGTDADPVYSLFLTKKLVEAILAPLKDMQPARIGWGAIDAPDHTAVRRWILRPDKMLNDPFGNLTIRANMHAASNWENVIGPTGPEDPELSLISVQTRNGKPIGLLANFSMHYFSDQNISADYFGLFSEGLQERIAPGDNSFVAMMSHGCSGDIWRHDYEQSPDRKANATTIEQYSAEMVELAMQAYEGITYKMPESIAMEESRMTLPYRVPDKQRLEWAQRVVETMESRPPGEQLPKDKTEVYAREQLILHERQATEIVVQALRLGDRIAIATTPNETYAITGLKIKNASPCRDTMVIELANGGDGYIPPPEQHLLGGYNTWPARTAGLEVKAEPKITETAISLLEQAFEKQRVDRRPEPGSAGQEILSLSPTAYYRLDEFSGPVAVDSSPNHLDAIYEPKTLFYLEGPHHEAFARNGKNRAAHFVDSRLIARVPEIAEKYTVSFWFWNGMATGARPVEGWLFSRGRNHGNPDHFDHVGIFHEDGKTHLGYGSRGFISGPLEAAEVERWTWNHVAVARDRSSLHVFLNGKHLVCSTSVSQKPPPEKWPTFFFGGRCDNVDSLEGKLDEIAIFDRALSSREIERLATLRQ